MYTHVHVCMSTCTCMHEYMYMYIYMAIGILSLNFKESSTNMVVCTMYVLSYEGCSVSEVFVPNCTLYQDMYCKLLKYTLSMIRIQGNPCTAI